MHKNLFFICPTDYIENRINKEFEQENYFYTSLGNSFAHDSKTIQKLSEHIEKHHIEKIYMVLSQQNAIVLDALGNNSYDKIQGLQNFYQTILLEKSNSIISKKRDAPEIAVLSYYLNKKIIELQTVFKKKASIAIPIEGKIFDSKNNTFQDIYPKLLCMRKFGMN